VSATEQNVVQYQSAGEQQHPFLPAIEVIWLLIALLVPLWLNLWGQQPFDYARVLLLRTLVWLMAGLWVIGWILAGPPAFRSLLAALRRNPLTLPLLLLAAVWIASTHFSVDWRLSLYGSYTRGQGLLTHLSYLLLFVIVAAELRQPDQARRLLAVLGLTALPIVLLGALQWIGLDPIGLTSDARSPVYTTLGRANFTGAYLAMLLPISLALVHASPRRFERWGWRLLLGAQVAIIVLTLARGAWLAAGVGLSVYLLLRLWPTLTRGRQWILLGSAATAALTILGGGAIGLLQSQAGSLAARATIWRATLDLIRQRPWFGYGLDSLEIVFPAVYPPQLVYYQGRESFVDRAHNLFLDWMVTSGGIGVAAGIIFFGAFFVLALRQMSRPEWARPTTEHLLARGALAAVTANLAGNLVSFDIVATAAVSWLLMGFVIASLLGMKGSSPSLGEGVEFVQRIEVRNTGHLLAATVLAVIVIAAIFHFNLRPLGADVAHRSAIVHLTAGRWHAAQQRAQQAVAAWPSAGAHHQLLGDLYLQGIAAGALAEAEALPAAEAAYLAVIDLHPLDPTAWAALGNFYRIGGALFAPELLDAAHPAYAQALRLAPHHASIHLAWGQVHLVQAQPEQALAHFQRAVDLDATYGEAYRLIGDILRVHGGGQAEVLSAYQQAIHWSPHSSQAYLGLAAAHWQFGNIHAATEALVQAQRLDPSISTGLMSKE
jgi:O-antigen ligase/tetratricopeptide (TPR) repeat protein